MKPLDMLKCCFNWKVAAGLGIVAIALFMFWPAKVTALLPTLLLLLCPISMGIMMFSMGKMNRSCHDPNCKEHQKH